jgi:protein-S-isoprenylcysteine O-methyltransferase Ste14
MRRISAIIGSALFFVLAPCTVAGSIPWWISRWQMQPPLFGLYPLRIAGGVLILAGLPVLLDSFARFALQGLGTPAPIFPTRRLVVSGWYRYVRNPMYVAVVSVIVGQALLFGNVQVLEYGALVWLCFHLFVLAYEEPTMRSTFVGEYREFCAHVPRWIPRLTPWRTIHRLPSSRAATGRKRYHECR